MGFSSTYFLAFLSVLYAAGDDDATCCGWGATQLSRTGAAVAAGSAVVVAVVVAMAKAMARQGCRGHNWSALVAVVAAGGHQDVVWKWPQQAKHQMRTYTSEDRCCCRPTGCRNGRSSRV